MPVTGKIKNATFEQVSSGKYFCVLNVEVEKPVYKNAGCVIGIDVGIKEFYSDSNGNTVDNPKHLNKSMHKLVKEQRKLSRMTKFSKNWNKQRIIVARIHEKIANQRNDFLHKESTKLLRENQIISLISNLLMDFSYNDTLFIPVFRKFSHARQLTLLLDKFMHRLIKIFRIIYCITITI